MHEGGDGKNCKTFRCIPDEPSKPQNFSPSKLLLFMVFDNQIKLVKEVVKHLQMS